MRAEIQCALRWLLWTNVLGFGLAAVGWLIADSLAARHLAAALADLNTAGFSIQQGTLGRSPLPAAENAAPLYLAAAACVIDPSTAGPKTSRVVELAAREGVARLAPAEKALLRAWLMKNDGAFRMVAGARSLPHARLDRAAGAVPLWMDGRAVPPLVTLSRALALHAQCLAEFGGGAEAREAIRGARRVLEPLEDDLSVLAAAWNVLALLDAWGAVALCVTASTDATELTAWLNTLPEERDHEPPLIRNMVLDLQLFPLGLQAGRLSPASGAADLERVEHPQWYGFPGWRSDLRSRLFRAVAREEAARALASCRTLAESGILPTGSFWRRPPWMELFAALVGPRRPLAIPRMLGLCDGALRLDARIFVVSQGLRCELQRLRAGSYPATLGATLSGSLAGSRLDYRPDQGRLRVEADHGRGSEEWRLRQHR